MLYSTLDQPRTAALARQADVGDDAASVRVYLVVAVLIVIGVILVGLAIWLVRQTRPDRELLAPLERMNARRWRGLDPQDRRRSLDEVRPDAASPIGRAQREPTVDREFASAPPVRDFSDLVDHGPDITPGTADDREADDHRSVPSDPSTNSTTGETEAVVTGDNGVVDPLVIDTVLADPSVLGSNGSSEPERSNGIVERDEDSDSEGLVGGDRIGEHPPADETAPIDRPDGEPSSGHGDDTGEHPSDASIDVPLMPGEGLLRRLRTDADQG